MKHLTVSEKKGQNYSVFELHGDFTAYTMGDFQKKLDDIIVTESVVLDLSKVTELDASGVGLILASFNDAESVGNKLYIMSPTLECQHALSTTGFESMLHIIHSLAEVNL